MPSSLPGAEIIGSVLCMYAFPLTLTPFRKEKTILQGAREKWERCPPAARQVAGHWLIIRLESWGTGSLE